MLNIVQTTFFQFYLCKKFYTENLILYESIIKKIGWKSWIEF